MATPKDLDLDLNLLNLLETSYLLVRLPAHAVNRTKRLIKAPKIYWGDTGVALHLAGADEPGGACTTCSPGAAHGSSARRSATGARPSAKRWIS